MTDFYIIPYKGIDGLPFGADLSQTRSRFRGPIESFKRSPSSTFPLDHFVDEGVFCYYDIDGRVEAIEFTSPSDPIIDDLRLLGLAFNDATTSLSKLDRNLSTDETGATSYLLGVGIYAPLSKYDPLALVENVIAFREGYYNC